MQERNGRADDPSGDRQEVAILTVPEKGKIAVTFLGPIHGIITHWQRNRSVACPGEDLCDGKLHRERKVWKGYAAAEWISPANQKMWTPTVIEVTENLYEYIGTGPVRGQVWRLWRAVVRNRNVEVRGQLCHGRPVAGLRTDIDVFAAVRRLYRTLEIAFDVPPPFGARQRLLPMACDPNAPALPLGEGQGETKPLTAAEIKTFTDRGRRLIAGEPSGNGKSGS
jgi:hypothetical protein